MPMDLPVAGARARWDGVGRWFGSGRSEGRQGCGQRGQRGQPQRAGGSDVRCRQRSTGLQPRRAPGACGNGLLVSEWAVDRRCGRCRDRRVKPLPGVRHNSRQCQRLPTGIRPDRYRRSAHQRRLQAAAGGNSRARVCGSLPIVRDTARRRVRSGQACSDHRHCTPPAILRPCSHAAMQSCSHAAMPRGATAGQGAAGSEQCQGHVSATAVCGSGNAAAGNQSSRSSRAQMPSFSRLTGKRVAAV